MKLKKLLTLGLSIALIMSMVSCSDDDGDDNGGDPYITVTAPNGGEAWMAGTTQTITWNDNIAANVKIELMGAKDDEVIIASTESDGTYDWTITQAAGDYKIKISSVDDTNLYDMSDANFAVSMEQSSFDKMISYIEDNNMDYINNMGSWIKNWSDIQGELADYFILDIRAADDYNEYHIDGAFNSTIQDMLTVIETNNTGKPVLVVCYTGQSASFAHTLLNLYGIEAYSLKWGMSIVRAENDRWTEKCSNAYATHPNWSNDAAPAMPSFDMPELSATGTGEEILDAQIEAIIANGFSGMGVSAETVMGDPSAYTIYNYWAVEDYDNYGHIAGAYQLTPATLKSTENLYAVDPDNPTLFYCWTGQTSASVAAYMRVLGYEAHTLTFGANSMIYDELTGHKWGKPWGTPFEKMVNYMEENGKDYINNMGSWIKNYADVMDELDDYFVLDIRSADDYNADHLPNAFNSTIPNMVDVINQNNTGKPVLVVCYTGQSASFAHTLLNLYGIEAYSLKWGMSIVSAEHDLWSANCSNAYAAHPNWSNDAAPTLPNFDMPEFDVTATSGEDILDERVMAIMEAGFGGLGVSAETVMDDPSAYGIYNYWAIEDYDNYGHISDTYQLTPATLKTTENLYAVDPANPVLFYCWTGQTSASVVAYTKVLGYDAYTLKFGVNSMIYDELTGHKWPMPWSK